jgi:predicted lactoylglutathione lyase
MPSIDHITLDVPDTAAAEVFYKSAFELGDTIRVRDSREPSEGFRGFTLSLVVSQPADVDALIEAALEAGATSLKAAEKSLWGYSGVVQAPDGAIWKVATSTKKSTGPATKNVDQVVLLLGVADVKQTKAFYVERGLAVEKSFGSKYVQFDLSGSAVGLGLYKRAALAKDAGVPVAGDGSHRISIGGGSGVFTDLDGFVWEAASA